MLILFYCHEDIEEVNADCFLYRELLLHWIKSGYTPPPPKSQISITTEVLGKEDPAFLYNLHLTSPHSFTVDFDIHIPHL